MAVIIKMLCYDDRKRCCVYTIRYCHNSNKKKCIILHERTGISIKVVNSGSGNNSIISVNVEKETYNIMIYMYRRRAPPKETMTIQSYPTGPTERRDEDINVIIGHSNNNNNIT